jgi:hypothetical protein
MLIAHPTFQFMWCHHTQEKVPSPTLPNCFANAASYGFDRQFSQPYIVEIHHFKLMTKAFSRRLLWEIGLPDNRAE